MIVLDKKILGFRTKTVWLSDDPVDVEDIDSICYYACKRRVDPPGFIREDRATIIIDLTQDIGKIWDGISSKCRSNIRRAESDGVTIETNKGYEDFQKLNKAFRSNKGLDHNFFTNDFMKKNGVLITAYEDDELISGLFTLVDDKNMLGVLAASKRLEVIKKKSSNIANANRLLWWHAIKYAKDRSIGVFDMGGYYVGSEPNPQLEGINEFKRRFGGKVVESYVYRKEYTKKIRIAKMFQRHLGLLTACI